jgi:hypothetical protein
MVFSGPAMLAFSGVVPGSRRTPGDSSASIVQQLKFTDYARE